MNSNQEVAITDEATAVREVEAYRPSAALNPERINFLWGLAEKMAVSSVVPESLRTTGQANNKTALPLEQIKANVFFVVEMSDRWNISPFALLPCASIVHGKLGFEGKVIDAVLEGVYGIKLDYVWSGAGESMSITITGIDRNGVSKSIEGTVSEWKTSGAGSPWRPATYKKMLAYRGAREWARIHKSVAILGINSDDDLLEIEMERRAHLASDVTSRPALSRYSGRTADGTDAADINRQLTAAGANGDSVAKTPNTEAQRKAQVKDPAPASSERSQASAQESDISGSGTSDAKTASSSQPDLLPASPPPAGSNGEASPQGQTSGADGTQLSVPSAPDRLRSYSKALLSINDGGPAKLVRQSNAWVARYEGFVGAEETKRAQIYDAHAARLADGADIEGTKARVEGIIGA